MSGRHAGLDPLQTIRSAVRIPSALSGLAREKDLKPPAVTPAVHYEAPRPRCQAIKGAPPPVQKTTYRNDLPGAAFGPLLLHWRSQLGAGKYDPASPNGQKLIAHELNHVVQQYQGRIRNGNK